MFVAFQEQPAAGVPQPAANRRTSVAFSPHPPHSDSTSATSGSPSPRQLKTKKINLDADSSDDDLLSSDDDSDMDSSQSPVRVAATTESEFHPSRQRRGSLQRTRSGGFINQSLQPKMPGHLQRTSSFANKAAAHPAVAPNAMHRAPRRQSVSMISESGGDTSLPQTMRDMIKRAEEARSGVLPKPINGNLKVRRIMEELRHARASHKASADEMGGGGDLNRIELLRKSLEAAKHKTVVEIERMGERISVESQDTKFAVQAQLEELVTETDRHAGNSEVLACLMRNIVTIDFPTVIVQKNWLNKVVQDGSPSYLDVFLCLPDLATNLTLEMAKQLVSGCIRHKHRKSSLMLVLTKCSVNCPIFGHQRKDLEPLWQEAFEILCSNATFVENEDRTGRYEAIELLLLHPCVELKHDHEAKDKQTVFSRAAREGDLRLVQMLIQRKKVSDINRIQSDHTNALMQAAARNHVVIVQYLAKLEGIAPSFKHVLPGKGSAIEIAVKMKRDPRIINTLRERANGLKISHEGDVVPKAKKEEIPSFLLSPEQLREQEEKERANAVDATASIKILLATITPLYEVMGEFEKIPTPTTEELRQLREHRENIEHAKGNMMTKMAKLGERLQIKKPEIIDKLIELLDRCVHETDRRGGNTELFTAVHRRVVGLDLAKIAISKRWLVECCANGSVWYLEFLSNLPSMGTQINPTATKDCLVAASRNKIDRIAVTTNILNNGKTHQLEELKVLLQPCWQTLFEDIASSRRANAQEQRQGRLELLRMMLQDPAVVVNFGEEGGSDQQTILSRAAAEGERDVVGLILRSKVCDPNRIQSDGTTPLIQAIRSGQPAVVDEMISFATTYGGSLNLNLATSQGTAMDVIAALPDRDDLLMVKARLIDAGAKNGQGASPHSGRRM